ncbi:MAG TPA: hypothetical protein PLK82_10755 [Bacteroidales bacterium]|nr:hypothetical protein [Bacteroidales bacterium]
MERKEAFRFLKKLALILFILVICDQGIGALLRHFYFTQKSGLLYRTTYAIDSTRADILVFGSSRANHHYVPQVFEDSLKLRFYNTGRDGNFILYNYAVFKAIVSRYSPRIILFDLDPSELSRDETSYERLSSLLPYCRDHWQVRDVAALKSPFEKLKLISATYPYNSLLLTVVIGNLEMNRNRKSDDNGYVPLFPEMKREQPETLESEQAPLDSSKVNALNSIVRICRIKNIRLVLVRSPVFCYCLDDAGNLLISKICSENHIEYLNLSPPTGPLSNPGLFADANHLNDRGAHAFSKIVAHQLVQHTHPVP